MSQNSTSASQSKDALTHALEACKNGLKAVVLFSFCINLLTLAAPLYMLQVFDRVIGSGSTDTLLYLTLITLGALATLGALEVVRSRVMVKLGLWLEQQLSQPVFSSSIEQAAGSQQTCTVQGLRDVATLRNFLTGPSVFPILDAPWFPIFLAILFLLHPLLGWIALGGALLLFALAIANDLISRAPLQESARASIEGLKQAESAVRNAHVVKAMGLMDNLHRRWRNNNDRALGHLAEASYRSGILSSVSKFIRQALQVAMMGTGAWLVLGAELTAGGMITGSILLGRALAPIDQAIGSWKGAVAARDAMARIRTLLASQPAAIEPLELPEPSGAIKVEKLVYGYNLSQEPVLRGLSFQLEAGETLGVIGPTATGKSTLASLLVGTLMPEAGHVRIDGADLYRWNTQANGHLLGYLPQNVELFEGSVAENIARMGEFDAEMVVAAARAADVHDTILALPQGYETNIGENGAVLSGGQRQRVALARALYGDPRLVVLDEPNASLDLSGDSALVEALKRLKQQSISTVIITHRPSILKNADKVLILYPGGRYEFGPREQMLKSVVAASTNAPQQPAQEKAHVRAH